MIDSEIGMDPNTSRRVRICRLLVQERKRVGIHLGFDLCPVPAWDMMLDLYLAFHQGRAVSIWSLCLAANIPTSTAHRKIGEMVEEGIFHRGVDGGRVMVRLTAPYLEKLDRLFDELGDTAIADGIVHCEPSGPAESRAPPASSRNTP
ncbi:MarR family transcriptional regulator [Sphingobium sp.]|uniref:MarR family transcriptional regulator n=1 Tax=Sphingobium sp. TaxID=1912891 RepID=UPI0028BE6F28|nr:MarR family transcriptional regulator [Sphingobium sp.]